MRIEQLTFTRFIAATAIVIYHFGMGSPLFNNQYFSYIFSKADAGVSYFFVLSGFVMIIAYIKKKNISFVDFLRRRLARIYPVYVLALFLVVFIKSSDNVRITDLLLQIGIIQSWVPGRALVLNYTGWSLSVEMFFYVLFPWLMAFFYKKYSVFTSIFWVVIFWVFSQMVYFLVLEEHFNLPFYNWKDLKYLPVMHLNEFLMGNVAGLWFVKNFKKFNTLYTFKKYIPLCLCLATFALLFLLKNLSGSIHHNGLLVIIFVPIILLLSISSHSLSNIFSKKPFVLLGEISFGIYILQVPVWILFSDYRMNKYFGLDKYDDFTMSFLIRFLILLIVSAISYLYFEKPIRNYINNYGKKKVINAS